MLYVFGIERRERHAEDPCRGGCFLTPFVEALEYSVSHVHVYPSFGGHDDCQNPEMGK